MSELVHGGYIGSDTAWIEGRPWLRVAAAKWIENYIGGFVWAPFVYEFGAGGSTVWFARLGCRVTSVEMSAEWTQRVIERIAQDVPWAACNVVHTPTYKQHADSILESDAEYDIVLVDGRARTRALGNARCKVMDGGIVVLDNSERTEYAAGVALYKEWERYEWGDDGWMTTVFVKPHGQTFERVELPAEEA